MHGMQLHPPAHLPAVARVFSNCRLSTASVVTYTRMPLGGRPSVVLVAILPYIACAATPQRLISRGDCVL